MELQGRGALGRGTAGERSPRPLDCGREAALGCPTVGDGAGQEAVSVLLVAGLLLGTEHNRFPPPK